jgi:adenylate cyclase
MGSEENVRLKFAVDKIGVSLNETSIIFGDSLNAEAWNQFISSLKNGMKKESEPAEEPAVPEPPLVPFSSPQERKVTTFSRYRWVLLLVVIGIVAGAIWKIYLRPAPIEVASVDRMKHPLPDRPSIAVLPFVNMSGDPKQEFFSDGITESIISALGKISRLLVIARNSTFIYKGKSVKVKQVSKELGVRYVLEGSVQRSGDRVRIEAQLIDALSGHQVWGERYERDLKDLFAVEDEVTLKILKAMQVKLTRGQAASLIQKWSCSENLECYLKYLEAYYSLDQDTIEGNYMAQRKAEEVLALCPGHT